MPSNLARLSAVARSALPRLSRKLRANPSLTRTTSPIWPSLATRSSRMTSIFVLLWCDQCLVEWMGETSGDRQRRRLLAAQIALAKSEHGIGEPECDHRQH